MTGTILVVDDIDKNVKLLEAKLHSEYYTVLTAYNGKQALEVLENNKIDVVLLDVMMPEMDGFETCRRIKANQTTTHIPVVMVTALSEIEDRVRGLEAGADEFLTKPINDTSLFARVRSLTRMKTVIDELKLRNKTNAEIGKELIKLKDNFSDNKILLIDDDLIQAKNIKKSLIDLTDQIKVITNANQLDDLSDFVPDLIIISCQLEEEDPLRAAVMIRSKADFKKAVLMLMAEEENSQMVLRGMEIGINDYFIYPVDKSEIQARVKTQLRRQQYQNDLRTELEESIDLSTRDSLTGVFNRRYLDIHIEQMINKAEQNNDKFCFLMIDVDNFTAVNNEHGHQAGDLVLKNLAAVLRANVRVTDMIARYGGEEFTIILGNIDKNTAEKVANKLRSAVAKTDFIIPEKQIALRSTISIGVSEYSEGDSVESIVKRSDEAMYQAKAGGKNKVVIA